MKKFFFLVVLFLLLVRLHAQAPPPLQDPFLDNFVGDWKVERSVRKKPPIQTSVHCEWVLNHQFIQFHYGVGDPKPQYEAFVFIGFDKAAKSYVCHWVDVFGATYSALGNGKLELNSIEFRFLPKDGDLTNKFAFDPQTKTWTSLIRQTEKGQWVTFAEEKWTKP